MSTKFKGEKDQENPHEESVSTDLKNLKTPHVHHKFKSTYRHIHKHA